MTARIQFGPDHPRSRGVYFVPRGRGGSGAGSSPLARGLRQDRGQARAQLGIIPARAGFTRRGRRWPSWPQDHPRSRGVYDESRRRGSVSRGSSPLARGLRPRHHPGDRGRRIIPARAGFTSSPGAVGSSLSDHPRSRGVYGPSSAPGRRAPGSSPLARGLQITLYSPDDGTGIIPARAGFTLTGHVGVTRHGDHPRSRGVYRPGTLFTRMRSGSSPLARGLPDGDHRPAGHPGIIPARAGFTFPTSPLPHSHVDHPRSRGVYRITPHPPICQPGSSPLARGLLPDPSWVGAVCGIIPARAGFTSSFVLAMMISPDHPRSRGVYPPSAG